MKETNMEHYRGEMEEILNQAPNAQFGLRNGVPVRCLDMDSCNSCGFGFANYCENLKIKWLMSEYKPEPVLTAREKHFVEFAGSGYLTRNENDRLLWWTGKPTKQTCHWAGHRIHTTGYFVINDFDDMFPFITWEDEEPWAVEELRKLKVANE